MNFDKASRIRLAQMAARTVRAEFEAASERFNQITARAKASFEKRDWHGMMADMGERLEIHSVEVDRSIARLRGLLREAVRSEELWETAKASFAEQIDGHRNRELAETFFNSVARRSLATIGKNPATEFDAGALDLTGFAENPRIYRAYPASGRMVPALRDVLRDCGFRAPFCNLERDAALAAEEIERHLTTHALPEAVTVETLRPIFFRQKMAYVIGRLRLADRTIPLVLPLRHSADGIAVDAVLLRASELSIVFSFTRSHFHVLTDCPRDLIVFLKGLIPAKPAAELYISLGFHKHGKTEMFRSLQKHLRQSSDRFDYPSGDAGMVMLVFTLPSYDVVFKVIRDRIAYPKTTTRHDVIDRYRLVFTHDRVGRLVEAQEFEHLELPRERFRPELLDELRRDARANVAVGDDTVLLKHVYIERRVSPLNVYLKEVGAPVAERAIEDYGSAIKELAAANIFPGDFLLKNFGVTNNGRVVFYDYDELCFTTDCKFRYIPKARTPEDEMASEPWFGVGPNDIFPEEFRRFLGLSEPLQRCFEEHHGDLFDAAYWNGIKRRLMEGEIMDVFPYPKNRRLDAGHLPMQKVEKTRS